MISDTHLSSRFILPMAFTRRVNREDIVIHLGDFVSLELAEYLHSICRLEAVYGNCDPPIIRKRFPAKKILELSGKKIGLTHGRGSRSETIHRVREEFEGKVDIALFGHTHRSFHSKPGDTVYFNPGSLTQGQDADGSFGLLHLDEELWCETIEL